jgi:hypothetical protein
MENKKSIPLEQLQSIKKESPYDMVKDPSTGRMVQRQYVGGFKVAKTKLEGTDIKTEYIESKYKQKSILTDSNFLNKVFEQLEFKTNGRGKEHWVEFGDMVNEGLSIINNSKIASNEKSKMKANMRSIKDDNWSKFANYIKNSWLSKGGLGL